MINEKWKQKKNLSLISYSLSLKNTWAQGRYNFTDNEYRTLKQIADADPMVKGPAVYNARVMLMTTIYFDNRYLSDPDRQDEQPPVKDGNEIGELYPNPANNNVSLSYKIGENSNGVLYLYDITGKLVKKESLPTGKNILTISTETLQHGVYLYIINIDNNMVKKGKLIIIK